MKRALLIPTLLLASCSQEPQDTSKRVQVIQVISQAELDHWCGKDVLHGYGCALGSGQTADGSGERCTIVVPRLQGNFDDREGLATWGHELLHCFQGRVHR